MPKLKEQDLKWQNMENNPLVSVITVNYNGLKDTCEMLDSIIRYVPFSYELIVVDNASKEDEASKIKQNYPDVICIRSEKNLGFAGGNNLGLKKAKGKYLLLLNNDTFITDNSITHLLERLESDPSIGGVSPKIKFAFSPDIIQFAGCTPLSPVTLRNKQTGIGQVDRGQFDSASPTPFLHGAAMMIKKEVIREVGLMPEIYFLYYEELDWCTRMKQSGYTLYYEPRSFVYHKESQSTGANSPLKVFYMTRNRMLYAARNLKGITKPVAIIYQSAVALAKNSLQNLIRGRTDLVIAQIKGVIAFFRLKNKYLNQKWDS